MIEALASHHVKDIAAGSRHCLALAEKGELFGWGVKVSNEHTTLSTKDCVPLPTLMTGASKCGAVYISCGSHEVCIYTCICMYVVGRYTCTYVHIVNSGRGECVFVFKSIKITIHSLEFCVYHQNCVVFTLSFRVLRVVNIKLFPWERSCHFVWTYVVRHLNS